MKFENLLAKVGDEGLFQYLLMGLLLTPSSVFNAFFDTTHLITLTPKYECHTPIFEFFPPNSHSILSPSPYANETSKKSCYRYDLPYHMLKSQSNKSVFVWPNTTEEMLTRMNITRLEDVPIITCNKFTYDQSLYTETATTFFHFVCDQDWIKIYLIQISIIGLPVMTPLIGYLSDR